MMMPLSPGIEARRFPLDSDLPDQAGLLKTCRLLYTVARDARGSERFIA